MRLTALGQARQSLVHPGTISNPPTASWRAIETLLMLRDRAGGSRKTRGATRPTLPRYQDLHYPFRDRVDEEGGHHGDTTPQTTKAALQWPLRKSLISLGEFGAGEGIRTLDPNLGKVVLYP